MARVYVIGTFDTKAAELSYVRDRVVEAGASAVTVDVGTVEPDGGGADVPPREVAGHHPGGSDAVFTGDRGSAVGAMAIALARYLTDRDDVAAAIGLGGSGGTALITPALRALPVGVPKVMVSTVASGDVAGYVDASDIAMVYSVTDLTGARELNRIARRVLGNAAHAVAGMASRPVTVKDADRPAVGLTMFGVTTPCVTRVVESLGERYEALVFHATGTGGRSMEKLVTDGLISSVIDISTTEVCDLLVGGVMSAGEQRLDAIARTAVPYVGSCGALDMVNFGARDTVPARYRDRLLYEHNPQVTLMRTTEEECARIGAWIAAKLNACTGRVRFLMPRGGVSMLDRAGQPFHDPRADAALFDALERELVRTDDRQLIDVPYHINDPEFARELVAAHAAVADE